MFFFHKTDNHWFTKMVYMVLVGFIGFRVVLFLFKKEPNIACASISKCQCIQIARFILWLALLANSLTPSSIKQIKYFLQCHDV